jgi:hypothetical protein
MTWQEAIVQKGGIRSFASRAGVAALRPEAVVTPRWMRCGAKPSCRD